MQSDVNKAKDASKSMEATLSKVNMNLLTGAAHQQWMNLLSEMNNQLAKISKSSDIQEQRIAFSGLSNAMYKAFEKLWSDEEDCLLSVLPMFNKTALIG